MPSAKQNLRTCELSAEKMAIKNKINSLKVGQTVYYFDQNRRVYREDKSGPIYKEYFRPLEIKDENDKEFILDWGTINKRSGLLRFNRDRGTVRFFTEEEKEDMTYIEDNGYKLADKVRHIKDAGKLKMIAKILDFEA